MVYERFTDRARKVMQLANQTAQRFNHECIGPEHILIGLCLEGNGVGASIVRNLGVDLAKIKQEVEEALIPGKDTVTMGKLPQTPAAKKVIEHTLSAARELCMNYVGTEHILIGLLTSNPDQYTKQPALSTLENYGITRDRAVEELNKIRAEWGGEPKTPAEADLKQIAAWGVIFEEQAPVGVAIPLEMNINQTAILEDGRIIGVRSKGTATFADLSSPPDQWWLGYIKNFAIAPGFVRISSEYHLDKTGHTVSWKIEDRMIVRKAKEK